MIYMQPIESSNITAAGHDPDTGTLRVQYRNGGMYDYHDVPGDALEQLQQADSPGRALREIIAGVAYTKVDPEAG